MKKSIEIGTIFGDLTVTKHLGIINYNNMYLCLCKCGKEREVKLTYLLSQGITHCGCKNFVNKAHANQKFEPEMAAFRAKASNYRALAKIRKIEFSLSWTETINLLQGNCFYCGAIPGNHYNVRESNRRNTKNIKHYAVDNSEGFSVLYNGIDRIDNTKGYIQGNVVSCCTKCNTAKLNFSFEDFKSWIVQVYNNLIIKNV